MIRDKDYVRYEDYPDYLYDDNLWNDAAYLWNKDIFYRGTLYNLFMTMAGKDSTTFDEYSAKDGETGAEEVLPLIGEIPEPEDAKRRVYNEDDSQQVVENINENIIRVVRENPEVEFYMIYSLPSIARWARYYSWGDIEYRLLACKTGTELLISEENVKLHSFQDEFEIVCDLDNYRDTVHYTSEITDYIIETVSEGEKRITPANFEEYFESITDFYMNYSYQSLREDEYFSKEEN